jgi:23S rRNA pseudouridine1911/1915/1917 synthase
VRIETGRTHQIRVHMASIGHPVVGDTLYGASSQLTDQRAANAAPSRAARRKAEPERLRLGRNFLHAAELEFTHPVTGKPLQLSAFLPAELAGFLKKVEDDPAAAAASNKSGNPAIGKIK